MQNKFLVIYGPTGVGKTDISRGIAQEIPAEIINMDVGQFYTPFTIGTAKPPHWQTDPIAHHMFDFLDTPKSLTVVEYRAHVIQLIQEIKQRGKLPILVGGSGFYLRSLLFPPLSVSTTENIYKDKKTENWDALYALDPQRALEIDHHDTYRIARAFQIWQETGSIPSSYKPVYNPIADYKIIFLTRDRQELYGRINKRVEVMLQSGWLSEVQKIIATEWEKFILEKKLIGYNELIIFLKENASQKNFDKVKSKIKQRTRQYAKRQLTFWRMLQEQIKLEDLNKNDDLHCLNLTEIENDVDTIHKDVNGFILENPFIKTLIENIKPWI